MTDTDAKSAMRAAYRQRRDAFVSELSPAEAHIAFSALPAPLVARLHPGMTVAGYVATGSEANPARLLDLIANLGCRLALPHITSRVAPMRFLAWLPGDALEVSALGIPQPHADRPVVTPDLVLAPLIAFDAAMMRLGQGGGHYDRALSQLPGTIAVGLAWSVQQAPAITAEPWDMPLDAVLTEKGWMTA